MMQRRTCTHLNINSCLNSSCTRCRRRWMSTMVRVLNTGSSGCKRPALVHRWRLRAKQQSMSCSTVRIASFAFCWIETSLRWRENKDDWTSSRSVPRLPLAFIKRASCSDWSELAKVEGSNCSDSSNKLENLAKYSFPLAMTPFHCWLSFNVEFTESSNRSWPQHAACQCTYQVISASNKLSNILLSEVWVQSEAVIFN